MKLKKTRDASQDSTLVSEISKVNTSITTNVSKLEAKDTELTNLISTTDAARKAYIDTKVQELLTAMNAIPKFKFQLVQELPEIGDPSTIYLMKATSILSKNSYDEYYYTNGAWEKLGVHKIDLDDYVLTKDLEKNYYNKTTIDTKFSSAASATETLVTTTKAELNTRIDSNAADILN